MKDGERENPMSGGSLSPWHSTSSGCGSGRWLPDMEGSCKL